MPRMTTNELTRLLDARNRLADRADRAFRRVVEGEVESPAYAQRLANQLEQAEGDLERACWDLGIDPHDFDR